MKKKVLVITCILIATATLGSVYLWINKNSLTNTPQRGSNIGPIIDTRNKYIKTSFWLNNDEIVFQTENDVYHYHTVKGELNKINSLQENQLIGHQGHELLICSFKNFERNSPEETATEILISDSNHKTEKKLTFKETIMPVNCSLKQIDAIDNYHGSPGNFYTINVKSGEIDKAPLPEPTGKLKEFKLAHATYYLEEELDLAQLIESPDGRKAILIEVDGQISVLMDDRFLIDAN